MQTAIMRRRSYSVNSSNKTSKTNGKKRIETVCSTYGVCMYVCLHVWEDGCTVCMCVHVSLNVCVCVCMIQSHQ